MSAASGASGPGGPAGLEEARRWLARAGMDVPLELAGARSDVLVVGSDPAHIGQLSQRAGRLKRLTGARYVTVELLPVEARTRT